jgi:hypothetical protein
VLLEKIVTLLQEVVNSDRLKSNSRSVVIFPQNKKDAFQQRMLLLKNNHLNFLSYEAQSIVLS